MVCNAQRSVNYHCWPKGKAKKILGLELKKEKKGQIFMLVHDVTDVLGYKIVRL